MKRIFYFGWLGFNNLGDELMWEIFKNLFKENMDMSKYELICSNPFFNIDDISQYDSFILGGGSLLLPGYINTMYNAMNAGKHIFIWGSGYDWADKIFIKIIEEDSMPTYLFDDKTENQLVELVKYADFVGVRGPLTYSLIKSSYADMEKVQLSGDPGLLVSSSELPENCPIKNWSSEERIIAVNWGTTHDRIYGQNENEVENQLASACNNLLKEGYKLYLYTMWGEDLNACKSLYRKLDDASNVIFDTNLYEAGQLVNILKKCSLSINFKLHANVLSAAAETPFICLGYRFKCFDFVKSLDLDELIVSTDSNSIEDDLMKALYIISMKDNEIREKLIKYKALYEEKLLKPFIDKLF